MLKNAVISKDQVYRYELSRIWDATKLIIMWLMLNPSTADGEDDDNTITRLISFTKSWGFGGFVVGNFYAFRCTDSKELFRDKKIDYIGPDNMQHLLSMALMASRIIVAPGNLVVKEHYESVIQTIANMIPDKKFYYLKMTKKGFPNHPLYLKSGLSPKRLEIPAGEVSAEDVPDIIITPSVCGIISEDKPASWEELNAAGKSVDHYSRGDIGEIREILKEQQFSIWVMKELMRDISKKVIELREIISNGFEAEKAPAWLLGKERRV